MNKLSELQMEGECSLEDAGPAGRKANTPSEKWQVGNQSIQVSHLEKVYWPETGFTKGDVLEYYRQIAPVLLPYLKDRPVTLRMYPQGVEETSYYLRDCPADAPRVAAASDVPTQDHQSSCAVATDRHGSRPALVLVNALPSERILPSNVSICPPT